MSSFSLCGQTTTIQFYHIKKAKSTTFGKKVTKVFYKTRKRKSLNIFYEVILTKEVLCGKIHLLLGFFLFGRSRDLFGRKRADGWCESVARILKVAHRIPERTAIASCIFSTEKGSLDSGVGSRKSLNEGRFIIAELGWYRANIFVPHATDLLSYGRFLLHFVKFGLQIACFMSKK